LTKIAARFYPAICLPNCRIEEENARMSKKKTPVPGKKPASKPATSAPVAAKPAKERKPRKPPLDRAIKLGNLLGKQATALQKNTSAWQGELTTDQRMAHVRIASNLKKMAPIVDQLRSDLTFLSQSGYAPTSAHLGGRASTFPVGAAVAIKDKRYDAVVHGTVNAYTVVGATEKYFQIQAEAKGSPVLGVPRGWLQKLIAPATTLETDGIDDDDENPGLSPED
jgi:hypothetical protein